MAKGNPPTPSEQRSMSSCSPEKNRSKSPGASSVKSSGYGTVMGPPPKRKFRTEEELIEHLQRQVESYGRMTEVEKRQVKELDSIIEKLSKDIVQYRHSMGGVLALRDNDYYVGSHKSIMERRIVSGGVKYMDQIGVNNNIRQKINDLRREFLILRKVSDQLTAEREASLNEADRLERAITQKKKTNCTCERGKKNNQAFFDEKVVKFGERWTELQQQIKTKQRGSEVKRRGQSEGNLKNLEVYQRELMDRWKNSYEGALKGTSSYRGSR